MNNTDIVTYNLPIQYNKYTNELVFNFPSNLKIHFLNNVNISTEGNFNLLSFGEMNLCSSEHNINIDSFNAAIHLNSERAVQLKLLKERQIILVENNIIKRKQILSDINSCLNKIIESIPHQT